MQGLKNAFWKGLYFNCFNLINLVSRMADFAASHIDVPHKIVDDGYNGERYPWRKR